MAVPSAAGFKTFGVFGRLPVEEDVDVLSWEGDLPMEASAADGRDGVCADGAGGSGGEEGEFWQAESAQMLKISKQKSSRLRSRFI